MSWNGGGLPTRIDASSAENADAIRLLLPDAIRKAEEAGLSIIAHHLGVAMRLAEKVAVSPRADGRH